MENKNYINCTLVEDENGMNHKIEVDARWKDLHHLLDMLAAITENWKKSEHIERVK